MIDSNPPAGKVWLHERGAPYRSSHEFKQIAVDNKAKEEIFEKRILLLAKQSAAGVEALYGRRYDFAQVKHVIRDAMILQRLDLPASMKPKVTHVRAVFLKRVLNAAHGFNIPLLCELMDVSYPAVYNHDMRGTGWTHFRTQANGGNNAPMSSERLETLRVGQLQRRQGSHERVDDKKLRENKIGTMFRAIKVQHKLYGRNMGNIREAFYTLDTEQMGTLTHAQFKTACFNLGLGLTDQQLDDFVGAVDPSNQGVIGYDSVLKPLHMELGMFREGDVPKKCAIIGMRRQERIKLLKENESMFNMYM